MGWGDELMVTGQVREVQQRDPAGRRVRVVYERARWHEAWEHNPRIARPGEEQQHAPGTFIDFQPRDGYCRPYMAAKGERQWTWRAYAPPRGELYFTDEERAFGQAFAGRIIVEPSIKPGASPNKDWGFARWTAFARLAAALGLKLTQLGARRKEVLLLPGVSFIETMNMRLAAAVLSTARAAVLPEGGMHHVCAAVGTPAVVIFGGYIAPEVTGYPEQASLFTGDETYPRLGCGMRVPCGHCARAMAAITPEQVMQRLEEKLAP